MSENQVASHGTPRRARWTRRRLIASALIALIIVGLGAIVLTRAIYDEWPWAKYPSILHACGRDFVPSGQPQTRHDVESRNGPLVDLGGTPGWFTRGELWAASSTPAFSGDCRVVMWVESKDGFKAYALSGGP